MEIMRCHHLLGGGLVLKTITKSLNYLKLTVEKN